MSQNIYHIMYKKPALDKWTMYPELEALAERLVKSGRLRIDCDYNTANFVRLARPYEKVDIMLSERELYDPQLLPRTEKVIGAILMRKYRDPAVLGRNIQNEILRLKEQLHQLQKVPKEAEIKLARIIVQSAHPVVIHWMLLENVEILVSYSHNIGDMVAVEHWQSSGSNSGMQSTDGRRAAVYISSGGDPFGITEKDTHTGDGWPAVARMMVIGAQEMGHYSDILRDSQGRHYGRHSADYGGRVANKQVQNARMEDIALLRQMEMALRDIGLFTLYQQEKNHKFYKKIKAFALRFCVNYVHMRMSEGRFLRKSRARKFRFIRTFPSQRYLASQLVMALEDMKFNLAPEAEAYHRQNPEEEEAVACIEALARVPQQVTKWGHTVTKAMMPGLYAIYYKQVIPTCITAYEQATGKPFNFTVTKPPYYLLREWAVMLKHLAVRAGKYLAGLYYR